MAYIGNTPADKFLTLTKQNFSTSATTSYTLDSSISSTQDIALFINNVRQSPVDAYTVSGTALTLTSATAGTDEMYCVYLGKTVGTVSPASDSVTTAMIQSNAVTGAKLNTDVISAQTALGAIPADTDELLVSDAGVLKRVDYSYLKSSAGTVAFTARSSASQAVSDNTHTQVTLGTEIIDTASAFASSTFTVPSGKGGNYLFNGAVRLRDTNNTITAGTVSLRVDGTQVANEFTNRESFSYDWNMRNLTQQTTAILNLSAGEAVTLYGYISSSNTAAQTFDQAQFMGVRLS